jgi:hypothetical protein
MKKAKLNNLFWTLNASLVLSVVLSACGQDGSNPFTPAPGNPPGPNSTQNQDPQPQNPEPKPQPTPVPNGNNAYLNNEGCNQGQRNMAGMCVTNGSIENECSQAQGVWGNNVCRIERRIYSIGSQPVRLGPTSSFGNSKSVVRFAGANPYYTSYGNSGGTVVRAKTHDTLTYSGGTGRYGIYRHKSGFISTDKCDKYNFDGTDATSTVIQNSGYPVGLMASDGVKLYPLAQATSFRIENDGYLFLGVNAIYNYGYTPYDNDFCGEWWSRNLQISFKHCEDSGRNTVTCPN